jgi:hypothetical protein
MPLKVLLPAGAHKVTLTDDPATLVAFQSTVTKLPLLKLKLTSQTRNVSVLHIRSPGLLGNQVHICLGRHTKPGTPAFWIPSKYRTFRIF